MRRLLLFTLIFLGITGCSKSNEAYENFMNKGMDSIEQEEYEKAEVYFEQALEEKENDVQASNVLKQTRLIQQAEKAYEEGELYQAEKLADEIISIEDGSERLVERAKEIVDKIKNLQTEHDSFLAIYDEASNLLNEEKYEEAIEVLEKALDADMAHVYHEDIKYDLDMLLKKINQVKVELIAAEELEEEKKAAALKAAEEKRKQEEEERKKQEEEKKKAEQQATANKGIGDFAGYWLADDIACHLTSAYIACAMPFSDFITHDKISHIDQISNTEVEVTFTDGSISLFQLTGNHSVLHTPGGYTFNRVSKEQANAIYEGYYELP